MQQPVQPIFDIAPSHQALFREFGLTGETVFTDARIHVWRKLPDRENATLDLVTVAGTHVRLHVKRYPPAAAAMARNEMNGFRLLHQQEIPAASIVAHGFRGDGSSVVILEDLAGYTPADKAIDAGLPFDQLLNATADLAALLHNKGLHHRDLYLCHFMVRPTGDSVDAKLIDMARVDRMRSVLTRRRWIIKDIGQFWYSTQSLPVTDEQRGRWLKRYCDQRKIGIDRFIGAVRRKSNMIARHDKRLQSKQPGRNVSIGSPTR